MPARLMKCKRPESHEEELHLVRFEHHGCEAWMRMHQEQGAEVAAGKDIVLFPIGVYGSGMPSGVPFEVYSTEPCEACNAILRAWAQWEGRTVIDLGAK